jgi:hypothetical protein
MVEAALAGMRRDRRTRLLQGLYLLGASGLSVEKELRAVMETALGVSDGNASVKRAFSYDLPNLGWVIRNTPYFIRSSRLAILHLSASGYHTCRELGWPAIVSEWEHLIQSHEGTLFPRHTLGLLAFCWQARSRGWRTRLLPNVSRYLEPDVVISKSDVTIYVEFEIRAHEKLGKWKKIHLFQGFVAIHSFLPTTRQGLVAECKMCRIPGVAGDINTLLQDKGKLTSSLWCEKWGQW